MRAYSLYGDAASLGSPNRICPSVSDNCCGPKDQDAIEHLWRRVLKRITKFQILFLYMVKYILTQFQDWQRISTDIMKVSKHFKKEMLFHEQKKLDFVYSYKNVKILINSDLVELAKLIALNPLSSTQLEIMYREFNQSVEFMINARRNFYCTICSASGQNSIQRSGNFLRHMWTSVLFSDKICNVFVQHHLMHFHSYLNFFKRLQRFIEFLPYFLVIDNSARLLESKPIDIHHRLLTQNKSILGEPITPPNPNGFQINHIEGSQEQKQTVNSSPNGITGPGIRNRQDKSFQGGYIELDADYPFEYKNVDFTNLPHFKSSLGDAINNESIELCANTPSFLLCEHYCQQFNFAKATDTFDGDIDSLKRTFDILRNYKYKVKFLKENDFNVDFVKIERYVDQYYEHPDILGLFIISTDPAALDVSRLSTDFTTLSNVNPFALGNGNTLEFHFKFISVFQSGILLIIILLFSLF
jgi:hypothetical protein